MSDGLGGVTPVARRAARERAGRLWETAAPVEVTRPGRAMTSVLSVRMSRDLLRELTVAARREGTGPATLARELIEQGLAADPEASTALAARVLERLLAQVNRGRDPSR